MNISVPQHRFYLHDNKSTEHIANFTYIAMYYKHEIIQ